MSRYVRVELGLHGHRWIGAGLAEEMMVDKNHFAVNV
jgi:hypothetical protein